MKNLFCKSVEKTENSRNGLHVIDTSLLDKIAGGACQVTLIIKAGESKPSDATLDPN